MIDLSNCEHLTDEGIGEIFKSLSSSISEFSLILKGCETLTENSFLHFMDSKIEGEIQKFVLDLSDCHWVNSNMLLEILNKVCKLVFLRCFELILPSNSKKGCLEDWVDFNQKLFSTTPLNCIISRGIDQHIIGIDLYN
jgi:hypothetical protein